MLTTPAHRIAFLHLDSLCCLPALDHIFTTMGGRIGLVISSDRFSGNAGGFWKQFLRSASRSGLRLTLTLGFDIVALRIAAFFAPAMRLLGRHAALFTLREYARQVGATFVVASDVNAPQILKVLQDFAPDLVVTFHFDQILKRKFIEGVGVPIINVHPAVLPAHGGPCPAFWMLANGEAIVGVTIHFITDERIDAGPSVCHRERTLDPSLCMAELDDRLLQDGGALLVDILKTGLRINAEMQPENRSGPGSYESFPDSNHVVAARRRGVRLWRFSHSARRICEMFGWCRPFRLR